MKISLKSVTRNFLYNTTAFYKRQRSIRIISDFDKVEAFVSTLEDRGHGKRDCHTYLSIQCDNRICTCAMVANKIDILIYT